MGPEELKQKLRDLGLDPENPSWGRSKATDLGKLPIVSKQRAALAKIAELLEAQATSDQAQITALREQLARARRGGGR